ncbi:MAG: hypothetical protein HY862_15450 [Chloroflexi bacterium]|nr:hypothetical protein [Chloroflexota bacterium]
MSNLPPVEPPDLRNRRQQNQGNYQSSQNYPPQNSNNYPPPGQPRPQPRQPQQQPQQPAYPPPNQGNYPPPGYNPPPQQPQQPQQPRPQPRQPQQPSYPPPGQQPPPADPGWDDPIPPARRGSSRGSSAPSTPRSTGLEDVNAPDLRRGGRNYDNYDAPGQPPRRRNSGGIFSEGQFEALIWGIVVIMLGFSVILALTSNPDWLTSYWPLFSGILLVGSIIFQKAIMNWRVSPLTQLLATLLISYSITQFIAGTNEDNGFLTIVAYYLGTCIITAGIIILSGIFKRDGA